MKAGGLQTVACPLGGEMGDLEVSSADTKSMGKYTVSGPFCMFEKGLAFSVINGSIILLHNKTALKQAGKCYTINSFLQVSQEDCPFYVCSEAEGFMEPARHCH